MILAQFHHQHSPGWGVAMMINRDLHSISSFFYLIHARLRMQHDVWMGELGNDPISDSIPIRSCQYWIIVLILIMTYILKWWIYPCINDFPCFSWDMDVAIWNMIILMLNGYLGSKNARDNLEPDFQETLAWKCWHTWPIMALCSVINFDWFFLYFIILSTVIAK